MGQDLNQANNLKSVDNPFDVYLCLFKCNLTIPESNVAINFNENDNLKELCTRFSGNEFKKALTIDNVYRIKHLSFLEYSHFLYHVIVTSNNFESTANQIFNSKGYEFTNYIDNFLGFDQIDVIEPVFDSLLNENGWQFEYGSKAWLPVYDDAILHLNINNNFEFDKKTTAYLVSLLSEIEIRILQIINDDCVHHDIKIEDSINNHKWLILYALASVRSSLELELNIYKGSTSHFAINKLEEITLLFDTYFREITNTHPKNLAIDFVKFLTGENNCEEGWRTYLEKILDKNLDNYSVKDRQIGISRIFFFLYEMKWFLMHYQKPKHQLKKGMEFSETIEKIFRNRGIKGFSESNIRNHHLNDQLSKSSKKDKIQLTSNDKNASFHCFKETNKVIEQLYKS